MIDYIEIAGFKSIKKMELELKPINILIGSNGSGKSNFISFFKLISAIFNGRLQQFVIEENANDLLYFGRKTTETIKVKLSFQNDNELGNAYIFELSQTKQGGLFLRRELQTLDEFDSPYILLDFPPTAESRFVNTISEKDNIIKNYISSIKIFHFHDTSNTSYLRRECDTNDNLYFKPDGRNLPAILYLIKENHPIVFNLIEKTIQSIAPYISKFILEPQQTKGRGSIIELRWIDKGDAESNFSAYQLSDGTLRFIAFTVLLMQPEPPSVIIIDEPELGLHPFAIGKLAGMVQSAAAKGCQIIIATQSPSFINHFTPEGLIVVDKSKAENQTIFNRLSSEALNIWLQEYTLGDLWERNIINAAQPFSK